MRVRVDEAGDDNFAVAVYLCELFAMFLEPGIRQSTLRGACRNNLPTQTKNCSITNYAEFVERGTATRTRR